MPERSGYAPGVPSWVDIGTDIDGAKAFYGELFGWEAHDAGPPEQTGGYGFFLKDGKMVGGYGPQQNPGPPTWSTYIGVADAEATAKQIQEAGGTVVVPPMEVMGSGTMAVFQDPQGAFFSTWQPGTHHGAELVNEPGSFCWNELNTTDIESAKAFYERAVGWQAETAQLGDMAYTEFKVNGETIAGGMDKPPAMPADVPPHWLVYFAVDGTDATVARIQELGGQLLFGPMDSPAGRFAVVTDAQGGPFGIITM